ncbi:MAG: plasmid replication/partition related protein [Pseudonocardiaceae bacterium]|nr:plasmid replication/partition related protein [Pseudonocardiaceae bacterium]
MLPNDELKDLAADITQRGQLQPIVLDADGRILDGRNRYSACQIAGVEPDFVTYDGEDPDGYALTVNITRRHLTKGQQAMIAARASAVCDKPLSTLARENDVSKSRVTYAKVVLDHAPDLVEQVVSGAESLDAAYKKAQENKQDAESTEAKMARLREHRPDLADQVVEELLTLSAAMDAMRADAEEQKRQRRVATHLMCESVVALAQARGTGTAEQYDPSEVMPGRDVTRRVITDAIAALGEMERVWKERELP